MNLNDVHRGIKKHKRRKRVGRGDADLAAACGVTSDPDLHQTAIAERFEGHGNVGDLEQTKPRIQRAGAIRRRRPRRTTLA